MKDYIDKFDVKGPLPKPSTVREWCVAVLCGCFESDKEAAILYPKYTILNDEGDLDACRMLPETVLDWELYELVRKKDSRFISSLEREWLPASAHDLVPDINLTARTPIEIYLSLRLNAKR